MKKIRTAVVLGLLAGSVTTAHADYFGTLSGRSADPANNPAMSVEGSLTIGGDYRNIGARLNYAVNEELTVYGDFGLSEVGGDGTSFGGGVFYHLPNLSESAGFLSGMDTSVQASIHLASLDFGGLDADWTAFGGALLISPKEVMNPETGMNWYANFGITRLSFEIPVFFTSVSDSSFEFQFGGGIYMPMGPGTLYAGADFLDEFILGVGYRYGID